MNAETRCFSVSGVEAEYFFFLVFNIQNVNIQYSDINIQYSNLNILYPNRNIRYSDFHIYLILII